MAFKKNLIELFKFFQFLFVFKEPEEINIQVVNLYIKNDSYVLINWNLSRTKCIKVIEANFVSYLKSGSAYIKIADNTNELNCKILNNWFSKNINFKLESIEISNNIHFKSKLNEFKMKELRNKITNQLLELEIHQTKRYDVKVKKLEDKINNKKLKF
jgi:hypothetical protein